MFRIWFSSPLPFQRNDRPEIIYQQTLDVNKVVVENGLLLFKLLDRDYIIPLHNVLIVREL